jgi:choline-sulfatase
MAPMRIMRTTHLAGGLGLAAATVAALWMTLTPRVAAPVGLVLITLDTTRVDRLSPYGFMNVSLPNLERLAREGVIFDQASSVAPLTLPAHTSLFTGLLPPNHGVRDNADPPLEETHTTLAEVLLAHGFRTGAFVGSVVLDPDRGLEQGFEEYRGVNDANGQTANRRQRRADQVIADAIHWLNTVGESRFFLWAHLYDPHLPYDPPEPYGSIYGHSPYLGEIAFADSQIGRLLAALEQRALLDRTLVIVAGDHGESLGERGERDHGIFIYENVLRVPLMVRARALDPLRVGEVVRLTDVMPTVLDLLDVPAPSVDGVSLVDVMRGRRRDLSLEAYSESRYPQRFGWSPLRALREGRFKLIDAPRPELYDLERDPFEEQNLYDERRALADTLTRRVRALAGPAPRAHGVADPKTAVADDLRERVAALGYVASGTTRASPQPRVLPDPKDCIALYSRRDDVSAMPVVGALRCN